MNREEILKDDWVANNYGDRGRNWVNLAFLDGVNWMEEKMIEKAVEWLKEEMDFRDYSSGRGSYGEIKALGIYDSLDEFITDFKQAMEK